MVKIFETFQRSWEITKQSFGVIRSDKEILLFPVLASIFSVIFFVLMAIPFVMTEVARMLGFDRMGAVAFYVAIFVFYIGISFISTFFNVGVVYCAKKRFEGGDPTFGEGFREAWKRAHLILMWSVVSATVGLILRMLEDAADRSKNGITRMIGSVAVGILGAAWSIASLFVIPAIVFNNVGPFEALKSSVHAIKKTWGESLVRHYGLGIIEFAFLVLGGIVLIAPAFLMAPAAPAISLLLLGVFVIYAVLVILVFGTAGTVFNTALYMYALEGKAPKVFSGDSVQNAFVRK